MVFYILDRNEDLKAIISNDNSDNSILYKSVVKEQLNKMYTLEMEVSATTPEAQYLVEENYILFKDTLGDWQLYVMKEVSEIHGADHTKEIYAEHASQELLDDLCNYEIEGQALSASTLLTNILSGTRWTVGNVTSGTISTPTEKTLNKSVLQAVHILRGQYSYNVKFRFNVVGNKIVNRYVDLLLDIGNDYGKRFEYNKDIEKVERVVNTADLKTAIKPVGKDGLDISSVAWSTPTNPLNKPAGQLYLENTSATAQWGYGVAGSKRPRFVYYENTEIEEATALIENAYAVLQSLILPKTTYKLNVVDLFALTGDSSLSFESVRMGDYVVVVDSEFTPALALKTMVIERTVDLLQPANTDVALGNYIENMGDFSNSSIMEQVDKKIATISTDINLDQFGNGKYADIQSLNDQTFHEAVGYSYMKDTEGLWVYDNPVELSPTKVVAIKGGKLGIGKWNTQTMRWDIGTFIDGDTVNASLINAGTLSADRIQAGSLNINKFDTVTRSTIDGKADVYYVNSQLSVRDGEISSKASQTQVDEIADNIVYKLDIISSNGQIFKNGVISTTLMARVYHGSTDVTDSIDANRFRWKRISLDSAGDTAWNTAHFGGTKNIVVTNSDVMHRATFNCEILES